MGSSRCVFKCHLLGRFLQNFFFYFFEDLVFVNTGTLFFYVIINFFHLIFYLNQLFVESLLLLYLPQLWLRAASWIFYILLYYAKEVKNKKRN